MKLMVKMRRLLCLVLSIFILLSMQTALAAQTEDKTQPDNLRQKTLRNMEALETLGIIPKYDEMSIDFDKEVTRADFADVVAKLISSAQYNESTPYFYDVPTSHWAYKSICSLAEGKIINGTAEHLFRPDDTITITEAVTMILNAMGYGDYAKFRGGYPDGYMETAIKTGILDGISTEGTFTNEKMYSLIYRAMTTGIFTNDNHYTGGMLTYKVSDETMLSRYHDTYYVKGVLNGANGVSLSIGNIGNTDDIQIDDDFYGSEVDAYSYLGEKVEAFYRWDSKSDIKTVVWVKPYGTSSVLNIDVNYDASFDSNSFRLNYTKENGKKGYVNFERGGILIYNGGLVTGDYDDYFNRDVYSLKLIKNKGNGYDIAIMEEYKNIVVGAIDKNNLKVHSIEDSSEILNLDENMYTYLKIKNRSEADISFSELAVGNILSVFQSADGEYMKVYVSTQTVTGVLESIGKNSNGYDLTVDGNTYFYPQKTGDFRYTTGKTIELYLDMYDRCAYIGVVGAENNVAYLRNAYINDSGDNLYIKVLHYDGKTKDMKCSDKVSIDGVRYKDPQKAYEQLVDNSGSIKEQLIILTQNKEDVVTKIDTARMGQGEGEGNLQCNIARVKGEWRKNSFDGRMAIDANTVIFIVPQEGMVGTDSNYEVVYQSTAPDLAENVYASSYKTKDRVGCEEYIVLEWANNNIINWPPIFVQEINEVVNDDDEIREQIYGYQGKNEINCVAAEGFSFTDMGLKEGDIIRIYANKKNEVTSVEKISSIEQAAEKRKKFSPITDYSGIQKGEAVDVVDGVLKIDARDESENPDGWIGGADDVSIDGRRAVILIYDSQRRRDNIYVGTVSDIMAGDYVVVENNYDSVRTIFVYK